MQKIHPACWGALGLAVIAGTGITAAQAKRDRAALAPVPTSLLEARYRRKPDSPELCRLLITRYDLQGRGDDALPIARHLLELEPNAAASYVALGAAHATA